MIEVELNLMLAELKGSKHIKLDIGKSASLTQLTERLGLSENDVGLLLVNKAWASMDSVIHDGDYVQLYPYLEGG